jgi:hypothetical protein
MVDLVGSARHSTAQCFEGCKVSVWLVFGIWLVSELTWIYEDGKSDGFWDIDEGLRLVYIVKHILPEQDNDNEPNNRFTHIYVHFVMIL